MPERYQHLRLQRIEHENERRRRRGFGPPAPGNPQAHATRLARELEDARRPTPEEIPGFDPRRLLKLTLRGLDAAELEALPGLTVVSEEGEDVTVLFATDDGMAEFHRRLRQVAAGRAVTRKEILWAVQRVEALSPEDRRGPALAAAGVPAVERCRVDVELWPLELRSERDTMLATFRAWCANNDAAVVDVVNNAAVVLARVDVPRAVVEQLLRMRDVRQVDLPPRYQLEMSLLQVSTAVLPAPGAPRDDAPRVAVLDSGIATAHPLLANAVGDAQSFTPDGADGDATGHGTHVAGLVLFGDVARALQAGALTSEFWLLGARIAGAEEEAAELLENRIERAVDYCVGHYGCRVFNLSFGDERRPYRGGHVDRLAATLDTLAHRHHVLFVVSAGNFRGTSGVPSDWRTEYPAYLLRDEARIIDPAPALNALTVGSLARLERAHMAVRFPDDPAYQPIARTDEPSPFSRSGWGPLRAIKPEVVETGGNLYVDTRAGSGTPSLGRELGELSTSREFARGQLFGLDLGTSQAAARVSNLAGRLLAEYPHASANLLRALVVAHADVPEASCGRFDDGDELLRLVGYGRPSEASRYSTERRVTLVAEETIAGNLHHFFELPLPEDFFAPPARRPRRITVTLSHMPAVRRTRLDYKEHALSFRVVRARNLDAVVRAYRRLRLGETEPALPEVAFQPGPNRRGGGTVQRATRDLQQVNRDHREKGYFVVVTSTVPAWAPADQTEPYALVVVVEDRSEAEVRLYSQIRAELQARARARLQR